MEVYVTTIAFTMCMISQLATQLVNDAIISGKSYKFSYSNENILQVLTCQSVIDTWNYITILWMWTIKEIKSTLQIVM